METKCGKEKNSIKLCITACNIIVAQLAKERSQHALYFAMLFTLFLWTNGASHQTIEALHKCGLCISFSALSILLNQLASGSLSRAAHIARGPHVLCWDNINIKMSIFVEQRDSAPAKVQSGTFTVVYELDVDPTDVRLSPMLTRAQKSIDLAFAHDVRPTSDQRKAIHSQIRIHIINILLEFSKLFEGFPHLKDSRLKHLDRRKMPSGHHMKQYPLRTSTIDESSISGNIAVVNNVYINQLKINPDHLFDRAVPSINN
ncbi:hypothetical protein J3R83DRAFT_3035 [Lanmaoa asiatica]|nr:hypothetical protein J3R83DRAFT_3035 [Lanmaoa asiatica]